MDQWWCSFELLMCSFRWVPTVSGGLYISWYSAEIHMFHQCLRKILGLQKVSYHGILRVIWTHYIVVERRMWKRRAMRHHNLVVEFVFCKVDKILYQREGKCKELGVVLGQDGEAVFVQHSWHADWSICESTSVSIVGFGGSLSGNTRRVTTSDV